MAPLDALDRETVKRTYRRCGMCAAMPEAPGVGCFEAGQRTRWRRSSPLGPAAYTLPSGPTPATPMRPA